MNLGPLTKKICLECGASPPRHQVDCSHSPAAVFWGKKDYTSMSRSFRLATVQNVFDQGCITESEAKEILSGPLKAGVEATRVDDSACLLVEG